MLAITSLKLMLVILAAVPLVVTPILLLGRRVRKTSEEMQNRMADSSSYIDETIHEIRIVQAYSHESVDRMRFAEQIERVFKAGIEAGRYRAAMIASVIVLAFSSIAFVLWIGGRAVITGEISPGDLSAFLFYAILVANGVMAISETWGELQRAAGASERLMDLLSTAPEIKAPQHPKVLPEKTPLTSDQDNQSYKAPIGHVRFEQVTFITQVEPRQLHCKISRWIFNQERSWHLQDHQVQAKPQYFNYCYASMILNKVACWLKGLISGNLNLLH